MRTAKAQISLRIRAVWFVVRCLYNIFSFYIRNFKPLSSLCSWADWFESYLVANPEDRFSRDEAQLRFWCGCIEDNGISLLSSVQNRKCTYPSARLIIMNIHKITLYCFLFPFSFSSVYKFSWKPSSICYIVRTPRPLKPVRTSSTNCPITTALLKISFTARSSDRMRYTCCWYCVNKCCFSSTWNRQENTIVTGIKWHKKLMSWLRFPVFGSCYLARYA